MRSIVVQYSLFNVTIKTVLTFLTYIHVHLTIFTSNSNYYKSINPTRYFDFDMFT